MPADPDAEEATAMSRRRFLALAGASAALAAGCDKLGKRGEIVPYVQQPEGTPPGKPQYYASALLNHPGAPPVLVTTREGRPIKLEGNPEHPASRGAVDAYAQSATLALYDPDRIRTPRRNGSETTWNAVDADIRQGLAEAAQRGRRILLITPALVSPTARALVADFVAAYPTTKHLAVETFHDAEAAEGWRRALGMQVPPHVDWRSCDVVVTIERDFLGPTGSVGDQRGYSERRRPDDAASGMSRLWAIEGNMTVTGANADHRVTVRPTLQGRFLLGLLHAIVVERRIGPLVGRSDLALALAPHAFNVVLADLGIDERVGAALVKDLVEHQGRSAVLVADHLPASAHVIGAAINASLGNVGPVVVERGGMAARVSTAAEVAGAVAEMASGDVAVVITLNANPVYGLPTEFGFGDRLREVRLVVSSSLVADETAEKAHFVLPAAHDLESWGDTDLHPGTLTLQQPTIRPLFGARQVEESLLAWLPEASPGRTATYHDYLKARWQRQVYPTRSIPTGFDRFWYAALHEGFVALDERAPSPASVRPEAIRAAIAELESISPSGVDLVLTPSYHVFDGRFSNSGWLQELPHPITSHVWGNGAVMGRAMAERLGCRDGDAVTVALDGRSVRLPAIIAPGVADDVVSVDLGYGRRQAGSVGTGVGVDANALRASTVRSAVGGISPWVYTGATVTRAQGTLPLVRTQEHHSMHDRPLVIEGTVDEYRKRPDFVHEYVQADTTKSPGGWAYLTGQKWGMAIDLSLCTGCNACVVACTAENNVPTVGPEQVAKGREMQWIRIDHYWTGTPGDPQVVHQPMLCQHCDNAPCENVCPVAATAHSPDGLNEMTYNRCVGTRYCANNCPYKVRRFNYFNFHEGLISPQELVHNPEVTVRSRGVMEKCTFCVQRIREGQHAAKRESRAFRDGEVLTACQQSCPTDAIAFGDLNDPNSRVRQLKDSPRGYHVLGELGTKPAITYLARIRNPHPDLVS